MDHFNQRNPSIAIRLWVIASLAAAPLLAQPGGASLGACVADATHLCFQSNRFAATMTYQTGDGPVAAFAVQPAGGKPGFFQFANLDAAELALDLLDRCGDNGHYWVDFLGVSEAGWQLRVDDTLLGNWRTYTVPIGSFGPPVTHTDAFPCAPGATGPEATQPAPLLAATMDLGPNGRFRVSATRPPSSVAEATQLTRDSGLLGLFPGAGPNALVKIFYPGVKPEWYGVAISVNQTDVAIEIEDRCTGEIALYNRDTATTFADYDAFPLEPTLCGFFADGFESGDTAAWSLTK